VTLLASAVSGGTAHSFDNYRSWLEEAGFHRIKQHSEMWLSAGKPPNTGYW